MNESYRMARNLAVSGWSLAVILAVLILLTGAVQGTSIPPRRQLGYRSNRNALRSAPITRPARRIHPDRIYYRTLQIPQYTIVDTDGRIIMVYKYVRKTYRIQCRCPLCFRGAR